MVEPTGYSALDLIGFTDKGDYAAGSTYVKNDIVHYGGNMWLCKLDDTTGQTPAEGTYWTLWLESDTTLASMTDTQISSPADGDVLEYNSTASKWKNSGTLKALKGAYTENVNANGSKNVLPLSLEEIRKQNVNGTWNGNAYTINGITFTLNTNGQEEIVSVDVNGTNTSSSNSSQLYLIYRNTDYAKRMYNFLASATVGYTASGMVTNVKMNIAAYKNYTWLRQWQTQDNGTINLDLTGANNIVVSLVVEHGLSISNKTVYPMICLATDYGVDPTFSPWAKTNRQLTEDSVSWSDEAQIGAVNSLDNKLSTQVDATSGLTVTVNADKSVTVSATSNTYPYTVPSTRAFVINSDSADNLENGKTYKFSGCPSGGGSSAYYMGFYQASVVDKSDKGDGYIFTKTASMTTVQTSIVFKSGCVLSDPLTFKPMITPVSYNGPYVPYAKTNKELTDLATRLDVTSSVTSTVGTIDGSSTTAYKIGKVVYVSGKITLTEAVARWGKILTVDIGQNFAHQYAFSAAWDYTNGRIIPMQVGYGGSGTLKVELMQAVASGVELRFDFYGILQ